MIRGGRGRVRTWLRGMSARRPGQYRAPATWACGEDGTAVLYRREQYQPHHSLHLRLPELGLTQSQGQLAD